MACELGATGRAGRGKDGKATKDKWVRRLKYFRIFGERTFQPARNLARTSAPAEAGDAPAEAGGTTGGRVVLSRLRASDAADFPTAERADEAVAATEEGETVGVGHIEDVAAVEAGGAVEEVAILIAETAIGIVAVRAGVGQ